MNEKTDNELGIADILKAFARNTALSQDGGLLEDDDGNKMITCRIGWKDETMPFGDQTVWIWYSQSKIMIQNEFGRIKSFFGEIKHASIVVMDDVTEEQMKDPLFNMLVLAGDKTQVITRVLTYNEIDEYFLFATTNNKIIFEEELSNICEIILGSLAMKNKPFVISPFIKNCVKNMKEFERLIGVKNV